MEQDEEDECQRYEQLENGDESVQDLGAFLNRRPAYETGL